jgi:hypothetical protein
VVIVIEITIEIIQSEDGGNKCPSIDKAKDKAQRNND